MIKLAIVALAALGTFFATAQVPSLHTAAFTLGTTAITWAMCLIAGTVGAGLTLSAKK